MNKVGLFFGPENGSVHRIAKKIQAILGENNVDLISVNNATKADIERYQNIIFGISTVGKETWSSEHSNTDWDKFLPQISEMNFDNKNIALYGLGDHITYPDNFVDSMGKLYQEIMANSPKANIVAKVSTDAYEYNQSEAVINDSFVGLPIDEDFQAELSDERIKLWCNALNSEFNL